MTNTPIQGLFVRLDPGIKEELVIYSKMRDVSVTKMIQILIERELALNKDELARYHTERASHIKGGSAE